MLTKSGGAEHDKKQTNIQTKVVFVKLVKVINSEWVKTGFISPIYTLPLVNYMYLPIGISVCLLIIMRQSDLRFHWPFHTRRRTNRLDGQVVPRFVRLI